MHNNGILLCFNVWFAMQATHYEILKIPETATQKEIRAAYLKQAKKVHPDKNNGENAKSMFQSLGNAYATLKDPELRRQYDASLDNDASQAGIMPDCTSCTCINISWLEFYTLFFFAPCLNTSHHPE